MTQIENFLTQDEQDKIIEAIRKAEQNTSGEIRVHIEKDPRQEVLDRATEVFEILKMENTQQRNAVLIYIAIDTRELVILGDVGINDVVPPHFWESTQDRKSTRLNSSYVSISYDVFCLKKKRIPLTLT